MIGASDAIGGERSLAGEASGIANGVWLVAASFMEDQCRIATEAVVAFGSIASQATGIARLASVGFLIQVESVVASQAVVAIMAIASRAAFIARRTFRTEEEVWEVLRKVETFMAVSQRRAPSGSSAIAIRAASVRVEFLIDHVVEEVAIFGIDTRVVDKDVAFMA